MEQCIHSAQRKERHRFGEKEQEVTIVTSIVPRNFDLQRVAINSWLNLGFKVISLNSAEEYASVSHHFSDIQISIVNRTAESITGKPYIFFDDVCSALSEEPADVCGIVNSDIILKAGPDFIDYISRTVGDGMIFGSRIDIDSIATMDGEKYIYGFDYFFLNKKVLKFFPESDFCLGAPWWDYWAPFVLCIKGVPCRELISPVAFHVKHETKWAGELFCEYGKGFANDMALKLKQVCHITNTSSFEQISVFSLDILQYILKNSDKVIYPLNKNGEMCLEVGRTQYLRMREQVLELCRRIWESNAHNTTLLHAPNLCCAELEAIQSSLSWRITKPLRWLGDLVKLIETIKS